ncbi:Gfo/Idh/MocA family oxidoreductase [Persicobacter diffluens]|uniref:Oxidoreductase n=1 Tax=Persicobacter diffluens TaxID=981 RepID=A0AAN5AMB6_9BACT|nr:oxidoreductase [Persicobacter diffluens]
MKETRRKFLKNSALAGMGLALGASALSSCNDIVADGKAVRLAIIGTGSRGRYLMEHLFYLNKRHHTFEVVAVCDTYSPHLELAKSLCGRYKKNPKTFTDYKSLIRDCPVDGVIVATPLYQHAHITIDCLQQGIHVFCEKAMGRTIEEVRAMYDAQQNSGSVLLIGHQRLFNQKYLNAMERLHQGEFGPLGQVRAYWHRNKDWRKKVPADSPELERQLNWRLYKEYSAGLLSELMSHQLQVANWAFQSAPVSVQASGGIQFWQDGREVADNFAAVFTYPNGNQLIYDSMNMNRNYGVEEHLITDLASLRLETNTIQWDSPNKTVNDPAPLKAMSEAIKDNLKMGNAIGGPSWDPETEIEGKKEPIYKGQEGDGTQELLLGFVDFIKAKAAPDWMLREAYHASIWTLLTEKAIDSGETVRMDAQWMV